jgi:hypothetical protein
MIEKSIMYAKVPSHRTYYSLCPGTYTISVISCPEQFSAFFPCFEGVTVIVTALLFPEENYVNPIFFLTL